MTSQDIQDKLEERDLSMTVFTNCPLPDGPWVVHLFCRDDPGMGIFGGTGDTLQAAITEALSQWDGLAAQALASASN